MGLAVSPQEAFGGEKDGGVVASAVRAALDRAHDGQAAGLHDGLAAPVDAGPWNRLGDGLRLLGGQEVAGECAFREDSQLGAPGRGVVQKRGHPLEVLLGIHADRPKLRDGKAGQIAPPLVCTYTSSGL